MLIPGRGVFDRLDGIHLEKGKLQTRQERKALQGHINKLAWKAGTSQKCNMNAPIFGVQNSQEIILF